MRSFFGGDGIALPYDKDMNNIHELNRIKALPSEDVMYRALLDRDSEYEGVFIVGVRTTGVFCRPTCTARKPKRENVEFFASPASALHAGYRPCKVCQPTEDRPGGQRAVGRANGQNRIAIVIPCHRVIRENGAVCGYGGGVWRKKWLLEHERNQRCPGQGPGSVPQFFHDPPGIQDRELSNGMAEATTVTH